MTRVYTLQGCWDVKGRILYMADKNDKGVYSKWLWMDKGVYSTRLLGCTKGVYSYKAAWMEFLKT